AYGKFINAGQTCVAPDYVLVHADVERPLLYHLSGMLEEFYGKDPKASPDYGRIVNDQHFQRLKRLLDAVGYADTVTGGVARAGGRPWAAVLRDLPPPQGGHGETDAARAAPAIPALLQAPPAALAQGLLTPGTARAAALFAARPGSRTPPRLRPA